jgi:hypothetical protein
MRFEEIEKLLGFNLPPSARRHRAWWSNNPTNSVMTKAWLEAGYLSKEVDLEEERLVFARLNAVDNHEGDQDERPPVPMDATTDVRHPLFGVLKGLVTIPEDLDLTQPADDEWGRRAHGERGLS